MARKTIIAGNWKMNLLPVQAEELVEELKHATLSKAGLEVVLFPQAGLIPLIHEGVLYSSIKLGGQNCSDKAKGAFTGETSPELLQHLGCTYCLAGHSERRELYGESDQVVAAKAKVIIQYGMSPIVCVGESLSEREAGSHFDKVAAQIKVIYQSLDSTDWPRLVLAYEPIWAIGTGKTATGAQADEMHAHMRQCVAQEAGQGYSEAISILYGGSANPKNAAELLAKPNIDGLLVGGASLKSEDFFQIIASYQGQE